MNKVKCIYCKNFSLKEDNVFAKLGLGKCLIEIRNYLLTNISLFYSLSYYRECNNFVKVNNEILEKRIEWAKNKFKI